MNKLAPDFESAIKPIDSPSIVNADQFHNGPPIDPLKRILTYESGEWEGFIDEWVYSLASGYLSVVRPTGSGDKGIDIAGFTDAKRLEGIWDNFQCKYYAAPLGFGDVAPEIGKILWHSHQGEYVAPRKCQFIAPRGASTALTLLCGSASNLKKAVLERWDEKLAKKVSVDAPTQITGDFADYVDQFDFGRFEAPHPREIIEQHKSTQFFPARFGGGLSGRPKVGSLPTEISDYEQSYTSKLFDAYSEHLGEVIKAEDGLSAHKVQKDHFLRSREAFFHAESLRVFVRDKTETGTFESLQDQIYYGVVDTCDGAHSSGFLRVLAVTDRARDLSLDAHPLNRSALVQDRTGICHQLANADRLTWKK